MVFTSKYSFFLNLQVLLVLCVSVFAQEYLDRLKCESLVDCGSCMLQLGCIWCSRPKLKNAVPYLNATSHLNHCFPETSNEIECSPDDVTNPKTGGNVTDDRPLESKSGFIVQMRPQRLLLHLRIGESYDLHFQYFQANYPVDLYYIIDNSGSMDVHKAKLAKLGTELAETMRKVTNDLRIGFGSFVDKVEHPFVITEPYRLEHPCKRNRNCIRPYSFKNHLSLTTDFGRFAKEVAELVSSGNLDGPEGGFDAIMQAIVCKKEVGWRPQARHLIVFSTDAPFHIAGDGKLVGTMETNDAKCHMKNGQYDGLDNDYPSVSQLNYIAKENNINLIFAVVKSKWNILNSYRSLSRQIQNSKVEGLDNDSKNLINLVVDNYKKIVNSVKMEVRGTENVQVKITPHCRRPIEDGCSRIPVGEVVNFTATIKPLKCAGASSELISLKPVGVNESLIVELETICNCDCESPKHPSYRVNDTNCTHGGNLVCGVCMCNENRHGSQCECDSQNSQISNETNCREDKPGSLVCSGMGICKCGKCECKTNPNTGRKFSGKYCDCDDNACVRENGILCNGKGTCFCGSCVCNSGWTGTSCNCPDNNRTCIREGDTDICSGKGNCDCGSCVCSDKYTGTYCEVCPTCEEKCVNIKDCVECTVFQTGIYDRNQCQKKCIVHTIVTADEVTVNEGDEEKICRAIDDKKCDIIYKYRYDDSENLIITVRKTKICDPNLLVWALTVVGSILIIGLITLLIWKIVTMFHDKREYIKFLKEQKKSKWNANQNPLYKEATTTFENPYYPH